MSLQEQLMQELKAAMKAKESVKMSTLRLLLSQLKNRQIEKREELTSDDELAVVANAVKKRKEAIELYEQSERLDLLEKEKQELEILSVFLPEQLSESEIEEVVANAITETGATTMKEMGRVMKEAMAQLKGKADGKLVQQIVRQKLTS
ncbi:MAG: GatB/YqeY domain-containing protein [bacterium]